ncbi:MAG TPA: hypothetical protein VGR81_07910 [Candidatus Acidoferrales bacterium]|nr:hypothetical protein [Candidatus Acidoferrales bacterium]
MPIPPQEAASALHDIENAERQSATAYRYQKSSPHLFLWGIIWTIGYAVIYARPRDWLVWAVLIVVGTIGSFWISWRAGVKRTRASFSWRYTATLLALYLFTGASFAVLPPRSSAQIDAFFPILIALLYVILGIWTRAARIALLGLALGLLTVGGYFWLRQYFLLWMAVVGGGALILGGFWLRSI